MKLSRSPLGFSFIELFVVLFILGVLICMTVPAAQRVKQRGEQLKDITNVNQIYRGLRLFATDNDGRFPWSPFDPVTGGPSTTGTLSNSNQAFQNIIPAYIAQERTFYVAKSIWTPTAPDEVTSPGEALKQGENAYAYVPNLKANGNPFLPIIADAFSTTPGVYTNKEGAKGSLWKGQVAIVVRLDGSVKIERCHPASFKVFTLTGNSANPLDLFECRANWLRDDQTPLNPL